MRAEVFHKDTAEMVGYVYYEGASDLWITAHPGATLREDVLMPKNMSAAAFARWCGLSVRYVRELARERRRMTPKAAWAISQALGSSPEFWMRLQASHDLTKARPRRRVPRIPR
jgi:addiction module HigA family antidote